MVEMLEWKIWGYREEFYPIYVWACCPDDAMAIARRIDPYVCAAQWTGRKRIRNEMQ